MSTIYCSGVSHEPLEDNVFDGRDELLREASRLYDALLNLTGLTQDNMEMVRLDIAKKSVSAASFVAIRDELETIIMTNFSTFMKEKKRRKGKERKKAEKETLEFKRDNIETASVSY